MTAIGFVIIVISLVLSEVVWPRLYRLNKLSVVLPVLFLVGVIFATIGVAQWLWLIMP